MKTRGAVLVELIWVLPVFFALTGLVIWTSIELNAGTAVRSALFSGLRLASARGNKEEIGTALIPAIETFLEGGAADSHVLNLLENLENKNKANTTTQSLLDEYYQLSLQPVFSGGHFPEDSLRALRREYTYLLVYTYAEIRAHLGGLVQYPCDPLATDGANCLRCQFLNPRPDLIDLSPYRDTIPVNELPFMAARCSYQPADPVSKALAPFFGGSNSFWKLIQWDGITSIYRHGYIDDTGQFRYQEIG